MRKRARITETKDDCAPEDYVSSLPDDVLVLMLSRLTLREACITSALSRRWQYLWTHLSGLDFDADDALCRIALDPKVRSSERIKYINWVNRVVRQQRLPKLDAFRICFDLDRSSKGAIDNWVKFAIAKGVQNFKLSLLENGEILRQPSRNYVFPHKYITQCKGSSLKFLKYLSFICVNVSEEALECFLCNCPALRNLSIHGSRDLANVKVSGSSLRLKRLRISYCLGIETIEISNVNIELFHYLGNEIKLTLNNVPKLGEISVGVGYSAIENNVFSPLSSCLHQLVVLTLCILRLGENMKIPKFPELPKLKELILKVGALNDDSLLEYTSVIKACPNLIRFVMQLIWKSPSKRRRRIRRSAMHHHQNVKFLEIVGYYGRTSDAEIAMYFIENAVSLQKIVIDPRHKFKGRSPLTVDQINREEAARRHAKHHLERKTPPGVKLIIL